MATNMDMSPPTISSLPHLVCTLNVALNSLTFCAEALKEAVLTVIHSYIQFQVSLGYMDGVGLGMGQDNAVQHLYNLKFQLPQPYACQAGL